MIIQNRFSKFDFHVMHYCLVIQRLSMDTPRMIFTNFCQAVSAYTDQRPMTPSCAAGGPLKGFGVLHPSGKGDLILGRTFTSCARGRGANSCCDAFFRGAVTIWTCSESTRVDRTSPCDWPAAR